MSFMQSLESIAPENVGVGIPSMVTSCMTHKGGKEYRRHGDMVKLKKLDFL